MFSQVTPSLDRIQGGLGIGLSLVRALVELHGGRVEAQSKGVGQGSEFIVRLPLAQARPRSERAMNLPAPVGATLRFRVRRIVVVDDTRAARLHAGPAAGNDGTNTCCTADDAATAPEP